MMAIDAFQTIFVVAITVGGFFTMIILISYFKTRKSERTALWASGRDLKDQEVPPVKVNVENILKYGLLLIGLGVGLVVGDILYANDAIAQPEVAYFAMLLVFGGVGLLVANVLIENKRKKFDDFNRIE